MRQRDKFKPFCFLISGGRVASEGELIDVVEMTISQIKEYISSDYVNSPGGFLFAVMWFLQNKAPKSS